LQLPADVVTEPRTINDPQLLRQYTVALNLEQRTIGESTNAELSCFVDASGALVSNTPGMVFRATIYGKYYHGSGGGTLTLRFKLGTTTLHSRTIAAPGSNQTEQDLKIEAEAIVRYTPDPTVVDIEGGFGRYTQGAASTYVTGGFNAAVDLTAPRQLDVTIQYGNSNINNGMDIFQAIIERIN
jgi:hypothetical protein